jgi:hypothetical protein
MIRSSEQHRGGREGRLSRPSSRWLVRIASAAAVVAGLLVCTIAPATATEAPATLESLRGEVQVSLPGSEQWVAPEVGVPLEVGTAVRTGYASSASVEIGPDAALTLAPETEVLLVRYDASDTASETAVGVEQVGGHIKLELRLRAHHYLKSTVVTPHAEVRVRTRLRAQIIRVSVDPSETLTVVDQGLAYVIARGSRAVLRSGESARASIDGPGPRTTVVTPARSYAEQPDAVAALRDQLRARDRDGDCDQVRDRSRDQSGRVRCDEGQCEAEPYADSIRQGPAGTPNGAGSYGGSAYGGTGEGTNGGAPGARQTRGTR